MRTEGCSENDLEDDFEDDFEDDPHVLRQIQQQNNTFPYGAALGNARLILIVVMWPYKKEGFEISISIHPDSKFEALVRTMCNTYGFFFSRVVCNAIIVGGPIRAVNVGEDTPRKVFHKL